MPVRIEYAPLRGLAVEYPAVYTVAGVSQAVFSSNPLFSTMFEQVGSGVTDGVGVTVGVSVGVTVTVGTGVGGDTRLFQSSGKYAKKETPSPMSTEPSKVVPGTL